MAEPRNQLEGSLYRIAASGSGNTWVTASGASGVLMGYVTNFTFTSAQDVQTVSDRGVPKVHKRAAWTPIAVGFTVAYGITGHYPTATAGLGSTYPMDHLELKMTATEAGASLYYQFHGVAWNSLAFAEATPTNTYQFQGNALAMNGPTASGYVG